MSSILGPGSTWNRWDPHLHTPGTLLNNQFGGDDPWPEYFDRIENASPKIKALGITDYYSLDNYEYVVRQKQEGRLREVELVFPNIECRLNVGTEKIKWVNFHLLVNPRDHDHVEQAKRFLARLTFRAFDDNFACSRDDLIRLGRAANPDIVEDGAALAHGATQFKLDFENLRKCYDASAWAKSNLLFAVAGGQTDGTSGVRGAGDRTLRQEIEKFAHIIFSGNPAQREFWLGKGADPPVSIISRYKGLKPCLHGSDAHDHESIANPVHNRFTWIKGALHFDTLVQACIDPGNRAFVGDSPPIGGIPSQTIDSIEVKGAGWLQPCELKLNPGLVAIIGARGSGKTALADIIGAGCDSFASEQFSTGARPSASFLDRAFDLLGESAVEIVWRDGERRERRLDGTSKPEVVHPRARYLSQQFVEDLCSSTGINDGLIEEIERVIFESHPVDEKEGALNFSELLDMRSRRHRESRARHERAIDTLSERIGAELENERRIPKLRANIAELNKRIKGYKRDRKSLIPKGSEKRANRLVEITNALEKVKGFIRYFSSQKSALELLGDEVEDWRNNKAPELLRASKEQYEQSRIKDEDWEPFLVDYTGDVDDIIALSLQEAKRQIKRWTGTRVTKPEESHAPHVGDDAILEEQSLSILQAESKRLQSLINVDNDARRQLDRLTQKISGEEARLADLKEKLKLAEGAAKRAKELQSEREQAYEKVFECISSEEAVLKDLYQPLLQRLASGSSTLGKLSVTISREVDIDSWTETAEQQLLDLRKSGPFKGRGAVVQIVSHQLLPHWQKGSAVDVGNAMNSFISTYRDDILEHSTVPKAQIAEYRVWLKQFAQWLFSTHHVRLRYGISYDGVEITKLSPGTRGIVLLLLYLALDDGDDRPLIIDQPEENLDPKSVFDELVELFTNARRSRQVIIVTHNANLVVNTDADQVIVAEANPSSSGHLPNMTYSSGGLEDAEMRRKMCDILEGGESAFKARAKRLRVNIEM